MQTIVKSSAGLTLVPLETRLYAERKIFLEGEITSTVACEFVRRIIFLCQESVDKPIDVYIDSPGGEVNAGLLIYDVLKGCQSLAVINLTCVGLCASLAAIILAGGSKGHRFILPHSKMMIHEPLISGGIGGSATSIQKTAQSILETKRLAVQLLSSDTGKTVEEIEQAIGYDNILNANEAIAFGLCDHIVTSII